MRVDSVDLVYGKNAENGVFSYTWKCMDLVDLDVVGEAGIEPTTPGLEGRCSIQLSYSPVLCSGSFLL
jgi:hypothetical protein